MSFFFFFFNDTATTEIYTLSLHDALPISLDEDDDGQQHLFTDDTSPASEWDRETTAHALDELFRDRKSTRLNSSHGYISYAVFCLKKKKNNLELTDSLPSMSWTRYIVRV